MIRFVLQVHKFINDRKFYGPLGHIPLAPFAGPHIQMLSERLEKIWRLGSTALHVNWERFRITLLPMSIYAYTYVYAYPWSYNTFQLIITSQMKKKRNRKKIVVKTAVYIYYWVTVPAHHPLNAWCSTEASRTPGTVTIGCEPDTHVSVAYIF